MITTKDKWNWVLIRIKCASMRLFTAHSIWWGFNLFLINMIIRGRLSDPEALTSAPEEAITVTESPELLLHLISSMRPKYIATSRVLNGKTSPQHHFFLRGKNSLQIQSSFPKQSYVFQELLSGVEDTFRGGSCRSLMLF